MKLLPRQKLYLTLAASVFAIHIVVALTAGPSYMLTMFGDAIPCVLLLLAILSFSENFRRGSGVLPLFWKLFAAGLLMMLLSQAYWFYYDTVRRYSTPSPAPGDSLFLLAHVFFLFALALRPHALAAGRDLRIRRVDFFLLALWWFALYGYFSFPWQYFVEDFTKYNPTYYSLAFVQHLVLVLALSVLLLRHKSAWRPFYAHLLLAFVLVAAGNLLLNVAIDRGSYYAGSLFDTPFFFSLIWFNLAACYGTTLEPTEEPNPTRELKQSVWTARIAMFAILSLPVIATLGYFEKNIPPSILAFRLRLVFGAMFLLGSLAFWKLNLLARELAQLVRLTQDSIENLKSVQARITHSQKLTALGRLAAGATHEISNPLTAILGYSELLADLPALSTADRENAEVIQQQVHHAQSAVNSLRNSLRAPSPPHQIDLDPLPGS